jgi:hypothetical protein
VGRLKISLRLPLAFAAGFCTIRPGDYGAMTKSRFLSDSEKKDVAKAAMDFLRTQHPGAVIRVVVKDETDDRGVPQYTYTIEPAKPDAR